MFARLLARILLILRKPLSVFRPVVRLLLALSFLRRYLLRARSQSAKCSLIPLLKAFISSVPGLPRTSRDMTLPIFPSTEPPPRERLTIRTFSLSDTPYISPSGHLSPNSPPPTPTRRLPLHLEFASDARISPPPSPGIGNEDAARSRSLRSPISSVVPPSPRMELVRAATFAGTTGDPLGTFTLASQPRRHTLAVPAEGQEGLYRTPSALSDTSKPPSSIGRAQYRRHDGPAPRPHSPCPSICGVSYWKTGSATTLPDIVRVESSASLFTRPIATNASTDMVHSEEAVFVLREPRFIPMSANDVMRYDRTAKSHAMMQVGSMLVLTFADAPFQRPFVFRLYHQGILNRLPIHRRTFTEVDICHQAIITDIELFQTSLFGELQRAISDQRVNLDLEDVELVLEPKADDYGVLCSYYFVHRHKRCLFWLEEFDARSILGDCKGVAALSHKKLAVEAQYCGSHINLFATVRGVVTKELLDEVKNMMLHATCDHLSSTRSTAALSTDELQNYMAVVDKIDINSTSRCDHTVVILSRMMHIIYRNQYLNFHGQPCARLSVDQTVHGWRYRPSKAMILLAPLLCMAPIAHVRSLHMSFVDDIASTVEWNTFITKLNGQLQNLNLLGTVLLGANVGFLAIQSVDAGGGRSVTQIASYTSLVFSFGSIALGLTFIGLNLTGLERGSEAANFLRRMSDERHGLEKLAIIYSLPLCPPHLSMLLFLVAFSVEWCKPGDKASIATVASVLLVVCGLIIWCIHVAQDRRARWWWKSDPRLAPRSHEKRLSPTQRLFSRLQSWRQAAPPPPKPMPSMHSLGDAPRATGATSTAVDLTVPVVTLQKPTSNHVSPITIGSRFSQAGG
ncbi:hypothetical protein BDN67DRAFT_1009364 [Paxillus ammoniavirescens]|nr:hypothetical protein BDN67DRAFT_1009364 [Paxillus ammoniavirescens]